MVLWVVLLVAQGVLSNHNTSAHELVFQLGGGSQPGHYGQTNGALILGWNFAEVRSESRLRFVFGGGYGHLWTDVEEDREIDVVTVYPELRFTVWQRQTATLFVLGQIGPSYMSRDVLGGREQGGNFTFRDMLGVGAHLGAHRRFHLYAAWMHFSNGNLTAPNAGIEIPFNLGIVCNF